MAGTCWPDGMAVGPSQALSPWMEPAVPSWRVPGQPIPSPRAPSMPIAALEPAGGSCHPRPCSSRTARRSRAQGLVGRPAGGHAARLERAAGFVLRDGSAARVVALLDRPEAVQPAEGVVDPVVYRDERRGRLGAGGRRGGYGEDQYGQQVRETQADAASSRERDGTGRGCRSAGTNTDTSVPVFTRRSRHRGRTRRCCASRGVRCAGSSPPALAAMADGRRHG